MIPDIGSAIAAEVQKAIDGLADAAAKKRLPLCLPMLAEAIEDFCLLEVVAGRVVYGPRATPPGSIVIAAATPRGAIVLHANTWPALDERVVADFDRVELLTTLAAAIDSSAYEADTIVTGLAAMLGKAGMAICGQDAARISGAGDTPVIALLVEHKGSSVTWLSTTVGMPPTVETQIAGVEAAGERGIH